MAAKNDADKNLKKQTVEEWFENLHSLKETRTKIQFYFQDILSGDNPTVYKVAESQITSNSPTTFGQISMVDDLLTSGPEPDSQVVGRAQGTISFADLKDTAIKMSMNIAFTEGEYKGSTITIVGRNPIFDEERELTIVGGTGVFRMARGVVVTSTHSFDPVASHGVLKYTLYVVHYTCD